MNYIRLYYHLIWATKKRLPLIVSGDEAGLYLFLRAEAENLGCEVLAVNGWIDHVHMVVAMPPTISMARLVKQLKGASSRAFAGIFWQDGYGALTLSEKLVSKAVSYVVRQKEHHAENKVIPEAELAPHEGKSIQ